MEEKNSIYNNGSSRKEEARALAKRIAAGAQNGQLEKLLEEMRKFEIEGDASSQSNQDSLDFADNVGIWKFNAMENAYERDEKFKAEWILWAKNEQIPLERTRSQRIVYLGESVARGYLYDPFYTPAQVLEQTINATSATTDVEVVDLAKSDMNLSQLLELANQSLALSPDIITIFAGNNFLTDLYRKILGQKLQQKEVMEPIVTSFAKEGFRSILKKLEDELEDITNELITYFTDLVANSNIKVQFIIPEFNLADWEVPRMSKPLPNLNGDQLQQWTKNLKDLEGLVENGDPGVAIDLATALIKMDPTHPAGYESLARISLGQNDLGEARKNLQLARDTSFRSIGRARMFSVVRDTLLNKVKASESLQIVDLQQVFGEHWQNEIPGRNQFLDYCHLTFEGIQVSMAHSAHSILSNFLGESVALDKVLDVSTGLAPDNETISKAHFYASLHNAHNGQPQEILYHHCSKSLEASLNIADTMLLLVDLASRRASNEVCQSFQDIVTATNDQQYPPGFLHPRNLKLLDLNLTDAILRALQEKGINQNSKFETLREVEHAVKYQGVNLLESYYSKDSYDERVGSKVPYYQTFDLQSDFYFVADQEDVVQFRITCKSRNITDTDQVVIEVNNQPASVLEIKRDWSTHSFKVSPELLVNGTNKVTIHWPLNHHNQQSFEVEQVDSFRKIFDLINYSTGEIYAFDAHVHSEAFQTV